MTQLQVATASGVHVTSLRDHEQGRSNPTFKTVLRLVRALGVSMEEFGRAYDESPETPPAAKPDARHARSVGAPDVVRSRSVLQDRTCGVYAAASRSLASP